MAESLMSAGGGGLTNSKLALANAKSEHVLKGFKFYAGDKNIKTGTVVPIKELSSIRHDSGNDIPVFIGQGAGFVQNTDGKTRYAIWGNLGNARSYVNGNGEWVELATEILTNRGSWGTTINPGDSVVIPAGYHDGNGRVNANHASAKVRTATLNASGAYSGPKTFTAAGTVICAGCQGISDGSYITVSWSGNQITVQNTANSGQNRNITIVYAYYI